MSAAPQPTPQCPSIPVPPFPSLSFPHDIATDGAFLCSTHAAWRFTVLWTLIVYAAFYLVVAGYAYLIQARVGGSRKPDTGNAGAETQRSGESVGVGETSQPGGDAPGQEREQRRRERYARLPRQGGERAVDVVRGARRNWRTALLVGVGYVVVGGVEAVLAGSVVGAVLGTVYNAGGFRMSTWVPLVWAVINVLFLTLSSFSVQERLL